MAQSAARMVSAVVTTAPATAPSASPSATSAAPKLTGDGGDVERVDAVLDPVGPPLAKKAGDAAESRIVGRLDGCDRREESARRSLRAEAAQPPAWTRGSAPSHSTIRRRRAAARWSSRARKLIGRNRAASAAATAGCTSALTSPPKRATSRTRLELR